MSGETCTHESWEEYGTSRVCADCREHFPPSPPADDVREALDEAFTNAWGFRAKTRSVMERDSARMWFDRGVKAMSEVRPRGTDTPPADDVREVSRSDIADEISGIQVGTGYESTTIGIDAALEAADAILGRFEVRLRGPVTDAEVEAAAREVRP